MNSLSSRLIATRSYDIVDSMSQILVVIDLSTDSYHQLARGVVHRAKVYVLDGDRDGITQITELSQQ